MATTGFNEADTRAKLIDPALHNARWAERVAEVERATHGEIQREQSAVRVEILDGKPFKRGRGRVDYLLRACVGDQSRGRKSKPGIGYTYPQVPIQSVAIRPGSILDRQWGKFQSAGDSWSFSSTDWKLVLSCVRSATELQ